MLNKNLIKKYKNEFEYFLNNGIDSILAFSTQYNQWYLCANWDLPEDTLIVINDNLVEIRKAFAEGKTIQYNPKIKPNDKWYDVTISKPSWEDANNYRIKPESKFKIGDIVRVKCVDEKYIFTGKITSIIEKDLILNKEYIAYISDCELWTPEVEELCWFWNKTSFYPILSKFKHITLEHKYKCDFLSDSLVLCDAFINELPESYNHLKK